MASALSRGPCPATLRPGARCAVQRRFPGNLPSGSLNTNGAPQSAQAELHTAMLVIMPSRRWYGSTRSSRYTCPSGVGMTAPGRRNSSDSLRGSRSSLIAPAPPRRTEPPDRTGPRGRHRTAGYPFRVNPPVQTVCPDNSSAVRTVVRLLPPVRNWPHRTIQTHSLHFPIRPRSSSLSAARLKAFLSASAFLPGSGSPLLMHPISQNFRHSPSLTQGTSRGT
jgi:hypothetical protein